MSMHAKPLEAIPEMTAKIARASFPKGTLAMMLRDALNGVYTDEIFEDLYPRRGRAGVPPWRLAIVMVLQTIEGLSDLQAAEMVKGRLDWKYALSLPLDDRGFDQSILTDFRQRLIDQQAHELVLLPILRICIERGWIQEKGKQRLDSTYVLSSARRLNSLESVGETLRAALNVLAEEEEDWLLTVIEEDWFDRYAHRFELQRFPKGKTAQEELRDAVGKDGWRLLEAVRGEKAPKRVRDLPDVKLLQQVWDQHYEKKGDQVKWRDGPAVLNGERIVSPYDSEARESRKRDTQWLGYKVHLVETCEESEKVHVITHVATTVATIPDVMQTEALLDAVSEKGLEPKIALMDMGYLSGVILVNQRAKGREIIGPVLPDPSRQNQAGYGVTAFEVDWEQKKATCPQKQTSKRWVESQDKRGEEVIQIQFAREACEGCEVRLFCTTSKKGGRTLNIYPQPIHEALQERRKEQGGETFQEKYAARSGIEGTISEGVRAHGMRRSRYRGVEKTHLQMVNTAASINIVRIFQMLEREKEGLPPRRVRKRSSFARLKDRVAA